MLFVFFHAVKLKKGGLMKQILISGALLLILLLSGCAPSLRVYHETDPEVNFSAFKTFSFSDWTDGNKKTITQMELQRIRNAVKTEMEKHGMTYVESGADIRVAITVFHREAVDTDIYPYGFYYYPGPGYARNYHYIERAISLDMYEIPSDRQFWHSVVVGRIIQDPAKRAEDFPRVAEKLFTDYPG